MTTTDSSTWPPQGASNRDPNKFRDSPGSVVTPARESKPWSSVLKPRREAPPTHVDDDEDSEPATDEPAFLYDSPNMRWSYRDNRWEWLNPELNRWEAAPEQKPQARHARVPAAQLHTLAPPPPDPVDDDEPAEPSVAEVVAGYAVHQEESSSNSPLGWQNVSDTKGRQHWFAADSIFTLRPGDFIDGSGSPTLEDYLDSGQNTITPANLRKGKYSAQQINLMAEQRVRRARDRIAYYRSLLPQNKNDFVKLVTTTLAGDGGIGKSTVATNCVALEQRELRHLSNTSVIFDVDTSRGVVPGRLAVPRDKDWFWLASQLGIDPTLDEILNHFTSSRDGVIVIPKYRGITLSRTDQAEAYIAAYRKVLPHTTGIWQDCGSTVEHELTYAVLAHTQIPIVVTRPRLVKRLAHDVSEGLDRFEYIFDEALQEDKILTPPASNAIVTVNRYHGEHLDDLYDLCQGRVGAITTLRDDPALKQDDSFVDIGSLPQPVICDLLRILALKFTIGRAYVNADPDKNSAKAIATAVALAVTDLERNEPTAP